MMPSLGVKYQIEIEVVSKPKAEYTTDEYFELDLPVMDYAERAKVVRSDGTVHFPLHDHTVDYVVSNYVLDLLSVEDIKLVFTEAYRILTPGGKLCLVSPTKGVIFPSRIVSFLWATIFRMRASLVGGGCRPICLEPYIDPQHWQLEYRNILTPFGVPYPIYLQICLCTGIAWSLPTKILVWIQSSINDFVSPKTIQKNLPRKNFDTILRSSGIGVRGHYNITACMILLFKRSDTLQMLIGDHVGAFDFYSDFMVSQNEIHFKAGSRFPVGNRIAYLRVARMSS